MPSLILPGGAGGGGGSSGMQRIGGVIVTAGHQTVVTFGAGGTLPQTFTNLKIIGTAKTTDTGAFCNLFARYNGDNTAGDYNGQYWQGNRGGTTSSAGNSGLGNFGGPVAIISTTKANDLWTSFEILIANYSQANIPINTQSLCFRYTSAADTGDSVLQPMGMQWTPGGGGSLQALTQIDLYPINPGNSNAAYENNSQLALYGIP